MGSRTGTSSKKARSAIVKYYDLQDGAAVAKWLTDRDMEFVAKEGVIEDLDDLINAFEALRDHEFPVYTPERIQYNFPRAKEITEEEYDTAVEAINDHNMKAKEMAMEMEGMTVADMRRYITDFPDKLPGMVNRERLSRLIWAFNEVAGLNDEETIDNVEADDAARESTEAVYAILKHVEQTGDPSVVDNLLKAIGD